MKKLTYFITILAFIFHPCQDGYSQLDDNFEGEVVAPNDTCRLINNYLEDLEKNSNFSGGLLIIRKGEKIFSKGYGWADKEGKIPFKPGTLASMGSITKSFTAVAILKLWEKGQLQLTDPLKKFFPKVPEDKAQITIHQLLTHSSGFTEFLEYDQGDYEKIGTRKYLNRAFTQPLAFSPGTKSIYTNVGMSILGIIIEKISGLKYETYLQKEILNPVGIKNIGYQYPVRKGVQIAHGYQKGVDWGTHQSHFKKAGGGPYWNLKANGGLEASLDEMYLWINAISTHQILNSATTEKMFYPHIVEEGTDSFYYFGYGCNISASRRNTKVIDNGGSNGIYFARILRLPEEGVEFYMVTNESNMGANRVLPNITQLYFYGKIMQDALQSEGSFESPKAKELYNLIMLKGVANLQADIQSSGLMIEDDMILLEVGRTLTDEQKTTEAIGLYEYYTQQFPQIIIAHNDLGDLYRSTGNKTKAIECYQHALKIAPNNERAKTELKNLGVNE
jgi:CubicO group peptidase (beta-lactamase class C family)